MAKKYLELTISFDEPIQESAQAAAVGFELRCAELIGQPTGQFTNPLDEKALSNIRWYLEEYHKWPTEIDRGRAHEIEANLEWWGRCLFDAIFTDRSAGRLFQEFIEHKSKHRRIIIESSQPSIQRLPWELFAVDTGPIFARPEKPISIYRRIRLENAPGVESFSLPLRVLMITSRPKEAGFIDPRTIARGMLDALAPLIKSGYVVVDFLRPPTLKQLDKVIREARTKQEPYHIVHFDGHGVYHQGRGLGQLAFEHEDTTLDLVDANRLGMLMQECGVPLVVLNACQSAQGDQANPFSSIATRLLQAGVGGVLSMSHSVLVVTAARFMRTFYGSLVYGKSIAQATDDARRELVYDTRRFSLQRDGNSSYLELQDWFLPVLYQQRGDMVPFQQNKNRTKISGSEPEDIKGLPKEPIHGFIGRARELLEVERQFRAHRIVVLHGWGGIGKTAFSSECARWFRRTGLFQDAAFISMEFCQSAEYVLAEAGRSLERIANGLMV